MSSTEHIILVDEHDNEVGTMEKLEAHQCGALHRAFSIFLFHPDGRLLMQQRAQHKYHSGGLWTNTCCSHPRPGEETHAAAIRRLKEEMGMECDLTFLNSFVYKATFPNDLTEYEYDHVFVGVTDKEPVLNPEEASDWKWITPKELQESMRQSPEHYSVWLHIALPDVLSAQKQNFDTIKSP